MFVIFFSNKLYVIPKNTNFSERHGYKIQRMLKIKHHRPLKQGFFILLFLILGN